jgi:hypothetical protein
MSNSRDLSSLGTIVNSNANLNVSFANTIANGFATATSTNTINLNVTGNSNLTYILANNSQGTAGQLLISGGSTTNVSWSSFNTLLNFSTIAISNTITFNNLATFNSNVIFANNVTFANAVTFSNTISVANINATYIANSTFNNYREQTYTNTTFGTSYTVDLTQGSLHLLTLTSNTTIYMPTANTGKSFTLIINTGSGNYGVGWNGVTWSDNVAPVVTVFSTKRDILSFISDGSSWFGFVAGQNF